MYDNVPPLTWCPIPCQPYGALDGMPLEVDYRWLPVFFILLNKRYISFR